ncbi:helix-turn-helix domain-containing protein [Dyadobacter luticola]|uniref:AraC family transcriptional regulator n=1 Tax=Dyadobacter luticola TaxID=1979387 RepID=A0A5R9L6U0_9BACT|nr:helix-turn-helix domain-containing protein [Dyadobacter luticola]TLV03990.1 AraC family transcriptional regulator [Dyadobacter luticola]
MPEIGVHFDPPAALADVIKHFYCIQTGPDFEPVSQHLSPSLEMMLIFNFGPPVPAAFGDAQIPLNQIGKVVLIGPLRKMLHYKLLPETDLVVVTFNAHGFYRLFEIPVNEMQPELIHDPDKLLGILSFEMLWESLRLRKTEERIQILLEHAEAFIQDPETESLPLLESIGQNQLFQTSPSKAIALDAHVSERVIQMRFQKYAGFSSKEHLRYLRFKQVIDHIIHQEGDIDWLDMVTQFGYHDQSHLIKDFKHYLDTTPRKFVQDLLGKTFCVNKPK